MHELNRQKKIELAALTDRLFIELAATRHSLMINDRLKKNVKTQLIKQDGHIYWPLIEKFNISNLAITLFKIMEVYESYGNNIPTEHRNELREIYKDLEKRKVRQFRNKYSGHILEKNTKKPISNNEINEAITKIRGESSYNDFEDWFWQTGRPNGAKSIAACLVKIRDHLIKNEKITTAEMTLVFSLRQS